MELTDLAVTVGRASFAHPIMNAAGHIKKVEEFDRLLRSESSGLNIGSIIIGPHRSGNEGDVYCPQVVSSSDPKKRRAESFALNSLGIPCQAREYYEQHLLSMVESGKQAGKPVILNIAGFNLEHYVLGTKLGVATGVPILEVNFGCPNLLEAGVQKPIFSYDLKTMLLILDALNLLVLGSATDVWVKFSPLDPHSIKLGARMIAGFQDIVTAVVTTNTWPNAMDFDGYGRPVITPNKGRAGMSGSAMRGIGFGQVSMWNEELNDAGASDVAVVGVGGASKGEHALKYKAAGGAIVQVGTAYFDEGENIFSRMLTEIDEIFEKQKAEQV